MTPDRPAQRRAVALLLLLAALGGLGVITLGAAAEREPLAVRSGPTRSVDPELPPATAETLEQPDWATVDAPPPPASHDTGPALVSIALSLLGAALVALAIWVALRIRALALPSPSEAGETTEDELTAARARAALEEARTPLSSVGGTQDAVIAAWLALERSLAEAGMRRQPSQTTLEFVVEVLATFDLDRSALDRLAGLYRRALFDPAPLQERDRTAALTDLDRISADLDALEGTAPRDRGACPDNSPAAGASDPADEGGRG